LVTTIILVLTVSRGSTVMAVFCSRVESAGLSVVGSRGSMLGAVLLATLLGGVVRAQEPPVPNPPLPMVPNPLGPQPASPGPGALPPQVGSPLSDESEVAPIILPKVPLAPPLPAQGPNSTGAFVESLRGNDASFDVLVNQARILTLRQNLTAGPTQPQSPPAPDHGFADRRDRPGNHDGAE
jgi:hypothetical protein